jgi:protoheme ferro-lyase
VLAIAKHINQRTHQSCAIALACGEPVLTPVLTKISTEGAKQIVIVPHFMFGGTWQAKAEAAMEKVSQASGVKITLLSPMSANRLFLNLISYIVASSNI